MIRDNWETPQKLFDQLNEQYKFDFDCCAVKTNTKCKEWTCCFRYYKAFHFTCWMNPPFSKSYEMFEEFFKIEEGVAIYRCDNMETKIWQEQILSNASWIFIFNKRIQYEGQEGQGARFPSALIGYNVDPPELKNGILLVVYK